MPDRSALDHIIAWMALKGYATGHGESIEALLNEIDAQARQSERRKRHIYG